MNINFEISENPKILVDKNFDFKLVRLEGLGLGDDCGRIRLVDVVDVYVEGYNEPYANFTDRIKQFKIHDGFIHMAGKFSFGVKNQRINEIKLTGKYMDSLKKIDKERVINVHGDPSEILIDSITWGFDPVEYGKILVYLKKKLHFNIGSDTGRIKEIIIGDIDRNRYKP